MIRKIYNYKKVQTNHIVWTIYTILFLSFSHNCHAQVHLDTSKVFTTEEDWSKSIDSLFYKGILDTTNDALVILRFKVHNSGKVLSVHVVRSANIDPSLFFRICSTIEDCYATPFLKNEIMKYQNHLVNNYLYLSLTRKFPKRVCQDKERAPTPGRKTN